MIVNIHDAKSTLSRLLKAALEGEEVIIAKAGKKTSGPGRFEGETNMDGFDNDHRDRTLQRQCIDLDRDHRATGRRWCGIRWTATTRR